MANFKVRVKVEKIEPQFKSETSDFSKTSVIGVVEGEYPENYRFDFNKKKQELVEDIMEGAYVTMHCNVRGKKVEKEGRDDMYFINLEVYKIELS